MEILRCTQYDRKLKTPLLDRRGGSRPSEASVWRRGGGYSYMLIPPPRRAKFASLIGLGTPPVQEGILLFPVIAKPPYNLGIVYPLLYFLVWYSFCTVSSVNDCFASSQLTFLPDLYAIFPICATVAI